MRPLRTLGPLTLAICLCLSQAAGAKQPPLVPPGVSGANQYTETLPGPGGNEPTGPTGNQNPGSAAKALGDENAQRLEALGAEGRAAAALAAGSAPAGTGRHRDGGANGSSAAGGKSGVGQILDNVSGTGGGEGMGILLPGLIVVFAVAAGTFAIGRHRARAQS